MNKIKNVDAEFGVDSRYKTKKESAADFVALMQARCSIKHKNTIQENKITGLKLNEAPQFKLI
ncbi:MAG: hypothetical protein IPN13_12085 [Bacteroidetes bacterium]|nr:hypothetical protein [Bacteroidota bacterium]